MDRELQELVARFEIISDVRNRDRSNFVTFSLENPNVETPEDAIAITWTVIASQLEPLAQTGAPLPINLIWICFDSGSADYKRVFKRRTAFASNSYRSTWIELSKYAELFEEAQYFEFDPALIGSQGERGEKGDQGERGPIGADSTVPGPKGNIGETGPKGDRGFEGERGPTGLKGDQGPRGERGEQGLKGDRGEQGVKGDQGIKGDTGLKGDTGERGEQGIKGDTGAKGDTGLTGAASTIAGPKGDKGDQGIKGDTGLKGDKGDTGERGEQGPAGTGGSGSSLPGAPISNMVPFTVAGSALNFKYEYLVQNLAIIENEYELQNAKTVSTSLATIFNSWKRFSHNTNGVFPASSTEINSWSYDAGSDILKSTVNSGTFIGFVSDTAHESYSHVVTLSSINNDDDLIAVILAFYIDPVTKKEYTLSAIRTAGGLDGGNPFSLYYNFNQSDAYRIAVVNNTVLSTFGNGAGGTGWSGGRATKVFATRSGNLFQVRTTQLYRVGVDSDAYVTAANLSVDLGSDARLSKFIGARNYGYGCQSQQDASFSDIRFTKNSGSIYDVRDLSIWTFNATTGAYSVAATKMDTSVPRARLYWNAETRKMFFYPEGDKIQRVSNASDVPYDISAWHLGKPAVNAILFRHLAVRSYTLPIALIGSLAVSTIAASGNVLLRLKRNGVAFASISFAAGSSRATFIAGIETVFNIGDILTIEGPDSVDATLADVSYNLRATLN